MPEWFERANDSVRAHGTYRTVGRVNRIEPEKQKMSGPRRDLWVRRKWDEKR